MSKRALVVEDDVNIAELLRLYLGKDGFDVMIAHDLEPEIYSFRSLDEFRHAVHRASRKHYPTMRTY